MTNKKKKRSNRNKAESTDWVLAIGFGSFSILMLIGGLALLGSTFYSLWHGYQSEKWPITNGEVFYRNIEWSDTDTYSPTVKYKYAVDDKVYNSDRILFGAHSGFKRDADSTASRYEESAVKVYYHPEDPSFSVLEPGIDMGHNIVGLIAGIGMIAFSIALTWGCMNLGIIPKSLVKNEASKE